MFLKNEQILAKLNNIVNVQLWMKIVKFNSYVQKKKNKKSCIYELYLFERNMINWQVEKKNFGDNLKFLYINIISNS